MAKTGSARTFALLSCALAAWPAFAQSVVMQADRDTAGLEDTFRLDIVVTNAPDGAVLSQPELRDFEVLGRSESTQMQFNLQGGQQRMTQVRRLTLTLRANRTGALQIAPATMRWGSQEVKSDPVNINIVQGRLGPERAKPPAAANPFGFPRGFPFGQLDDDDFDPPGRHRPSRTEEPAVPRGDSDLFVRMSLDKSEAYVGEQVMLTIHLYARIDLSSVDAVTMPKLDGFLSKDFKTPTQLQANSRIINGVPYREYLLRQKALFPLRPGAVSIEPAEADITTGNVLYSGRKVHRVGNQVQLTVKNLPPGPATTIVGRWRMSREISQTEVGLGEPVQVKLTFEGRGNLDQVTLPPLNAPPAFKVFDPEVADKTSLTKSHVAGTRVIEYTLVPQQTGTFTLPSLTVKYFDPDALKYEELRVDELSVTVRRGAGGSTTVTVPGGPDTSLDTTPRNQLIAGGLKSLRHSARFEEPARPFTQAPWFLVAALAPVGLTALGALLSVTKGALTPSAKGVQAKAAKLARKQLAAAGKLLTGRDTGAFYAEVEHALTSFMAAKLGAPVAGLTRAQLNETLAGAGVDEAERTRIAAVLDQCDLGRYAPGLGEAAARKRALDDARAAMEQWP